MPQESASNQTHATWMRRKIVSERMDDKNSFHRRSTASASAALRQLPSRPKIHAPAIAASPLEELVNE
jgi:hypothetical protein